MTLTIAPGDLVVVKTSTGLTSRLIAAGEALWGQASERNHVAVYTHDKDGVPWGVEGRPGGVGWVDMRRYLRDDHTLSNFDQPKTAEQRQAIIALIPKILGTPYDWQAIAVEAFRALGVNIPALFCKDWHGKGVPGHLICSSAAAFLYMRAGLKHPLPGEERRVAPSDWQEFILARSWA